MNWSTNFTFPLFNRDEDSYLKNMNCVLSVSTLRPIPSTTCFMLCSLNGLPWAGVFVLSLDICVVCVYQSFRMLLSPNYFTIVAYISISNKGQIISLNITDLIRTSE